VSVITLSPEISEPKMLRGSELTYYVYPERTRRRMRDLYKVERQGLREGISLAKPDVLHAHWTYEFAAASLEMGLPTLVTSHDNAFQQLRFSKDLYRLGRLYIQIQIIRKARFLTAVSPYLADSLRWLAKTEIEVIPNPVDLPLSAENTLGWTAGSVKIATVLNGWGRRKNPKNALKAFQLLRQQLPSAELFMYGHDFEEGGPASQWALTQGLSQQVHFCGFLPPPELQSEMRKMSLLLHPALEEACPLALLEAMAMELPIVADANAGGVPWVLDEGRAGFLTNVREPEQIAQAMFTCIREVEEREQKRRNAYTRAINFFSPRSVAEQYERAYEKVHSVES
jgi:glycosyltransferase involved in cell wall biosynthesis